MTNDDLLHLLSTAFVEYKGQWYGVPGGWVEKMRQAGLKVASQPPAVKAVKEDKTV